jgi:hypothetical protein
MRLPESMGRGGHGFKALKTAFPALQADTIHEGSYVAPQPAARSSATATVIPTLSFVFWQKMFTHRFDARLWSRCMGQVFPGADRGMPLHGIRAEMHRDLEQIRRLRNRIAHHEPIFGRALADDYAAIERVVKLRCPRTAAWMAGHDMVRPLLRNRPV